jgi:phosphatidate cytidylyltransferase
LLLQRTISAIVLIPLVAAVVYLGGDWYFAAIAIAALAAGYELYALARQAGHHPTMSLGLGLILLFVIDARYPAWGLLRPGLSIAAMASLTWLLAWRDPLPSPPACGGSERGAALVSWALTLAGALYVGGLAGHFVLLRDLPGGLGWTALMFLATWANDTGAYFVGLAWGRRPLAARISPRKTWEGAVSGWLVGIIVTVAIGWLLGLPIVHGIALGVVVAIAATVGDLAESLIKRQIGAKDSGKLIPGHGGVLDRLDSLLFSAAVVYYYLVWFVRV